MYCNGRTAFGGEAKSAQLFAANRLNRGNVEGLIAEVFDFNGQVLDGGVVELNALVGGDGEVGLGVANYTKQYQSECGEEFHGLLFCGYNAVI